MLPISEEDIRTVRSDLFIVMNTRVEEYETALSKASVEGRQRLRSQFVGEMEVRNEHHTHSDKELFHAVIVAFCAVASFDLALLSHRRSALS